VRTRAGEKGEFVSPPGASGSFSEGTAMEQAHLSRVTGVIDAVSTVIIGKREVIELVVTALLAEGHVLVEDIPGTGKTTLACALARAVGMEFKRIQMTPDMMPSDITGVSIYNEKEKTFVLNKGPVFTNILLADELNRTTPRTQSALLEAMNERQVSIDNTTYRLPRPFMVIATQNPVEYVGTYPLPEAQLDRFLMRVSLGYPVREEEAHILLARRAADPLEKLDTVCSRDDLVSAQDAVKRVRVEPVLVEYIISLVRATREEGEFLRGVSTRGALALLRAAQARAFLRGRDYVVPDDVKELFVPVTSHRVSVEWERLESYEKTASILERILSRVSVPL